MNTDKFVIRVVVVTIAAGLLISLSAVVVWGTDEMRKEAFVLLAGALIGFLARTTASSDQAQEVRL